MWYVIDSRPLEALRDADVPEDTERVWLWVAQFRVVLFRHVPIREICRKLRYSVIFMHENFALDTIRRTELAESNKIIRLIFFCTRFLELNWTNPHTSKIKSLRDEALFLLFLILIWTDKIIRTGVLKILMKFTNTRFIHQSIDMTSSPKF